MQEDNEKVQLAAQPVGFACAHHGLAAWPADWIVRIEHRDQLTRLSLAWDG